MDRLVRLIPVVVLAFVAPSMAQAQATTPRTVRPAAGLLRIGINGQSQPRTANLLRAAALRECGGRPTGPGRARRRRVSR